ncbi:hypothetical protein Ocin01_10110 [Orchesella cincta]|uniref:Uncharacterized protein n=1 Tax=Orchesella cincta TaxID=48709 RepID=A0A1D2MUJ1_ORCCI|nr:hypothetical protein Ocin01_10110 [Orchesella cincta]
MKDLGNPVTNGVLHTILETTGVPASNMESFDCVVCLETVGSTPTRCCESSSHPICQPCFAFYQSKMRKPEDVLKCPFELESGAICGSRLLKVDDHDKLVVQPPTDDIMGRRFTDCQTIFGPFGSRVPLLRLAVNYGGTDLCMLMVDENRTYLRMWLCEMHPMVEKKSPATSYKMLAPYKPKVLPKLTCDFTGQIQPFGTTGPVTDGDDEDGGPKFFTMTKTFLRRARDKAKDVSFKLLIQFMKSDSAAEDGPVDMELGTEEKSNSDEVEKEVEIQKPETVSAPEEIEVDGKEEVTPASEAKTEPTPGTSSEVQPVPEASYKPPKPLPAVFGSYGPERKKTKPKPTVSKQSSTSSNPETFDFGLMLIPDADRYDEEELEKERKKWRPKW